MITDVLKREKMILRWLVSAFVWVALVVSLGKSFALYEQGKLLSTPYFWGSLLLYFFLIASLELLLKAKESLRNIKSLDSALLKFEKEEEKEVNARSLNELIQKVSSYDKKSFPVLYNRGRPWFVSKGSHRWNQKYLN